MGPQKLSNNCGFARQKVFERLRILDTALVAQGIDAAAYDDGIKRLCLGLADDGFE